MYRILFVSALKCKYINIKNSLRKNIKQELFILIPVIKVKRHKMLKLQITKIVNIHTTKTSPPHSDESSYVLADVLGIGLLTKTSVSACHSKRCGPAEAFGVSLVRITSVILHFCIFMSASFEITYFVMSNNFFSTKFSLCVLKFVDCFPVLVFCKLYVLRVVYFCILIILHKTKYTI